MTESTTTVTHYEETVHSSWFGTNVTTVYPFLKEHAALVGCADLSAGIKIGAALKLIQKWNRMGKYPGITYTYRLITCADPHTTLVI